MKLSKAEKKFIAQLKKIKKEEEKRGNNAKFSFKTNVKVYNCMGFMIGETVIEG